MNACYGLRCARIKYVLLLNVTRSMNYNRLFGESVFLGYNPNIVLSKYFHKTTSICNTELPNNSPGDIKYSEDERNKILCILNESEPEELSRYSISKVKQKKILDRRKNEGNFETFEDVMKVEGLGIKVLQKMCDTMLGNIGDDRRSQDEKSIYKVKGKILEPALSLSERNNIKSICSLSIDLTHTTWSCIERDGNRVTSWDVYKYEDIDAKQLKLSNTMEIVWNICQNIPRSDVYVMEAIPTVHRASGAEANNPKAVHINLQKVQLVAMVAAAINSLENVMVADGNNSTGGYTENFILPPFQHKVFYLRPLLSARLFKTYIGKERVSPQAIVEAMLSDVTNKTENDNVESLYSEVLKNIVPVHFDQDDKMAYLKRKSKDKEFLSQALLLAITFMELCVCENIKAVKNLYK